MRVVFLGTPQAAVPSLEAILSAGHEIPLVLTRPDRPAGRSGEPMPPPVKVAALARRLRVGQPARIRAPELLEQVAACRPDALVVVAYGRILPAGLLGCPVLGPVNVHFSLLPRHRGAAPVQWALAHGEEITGVTTMRMNERMDEGDILLQQEVAIRPDEHAPELQERLAGHGAALVVTTLNGLLAGTIAPRPQDPKQATYAPLLERTDGEADFRLTAREVEGRVRGFDPWPGVWARKSGRRIRIARARRGTGAAGTGESGRVLAFEGGALRVACGGDTILEVLCVQPEGRRVLTAADAVNGRHLLPGDRLEGASV